MIANTFKSVRFSQLTRRFLCNKPRNLKGLVLGMYCNEPKKYKRHAANPDSDRPKFFTLTPTAKSFDENNEFKLGKHLHEFKYSGSLKVGKARIFYTAGSEFDVVAVVGFSRKDFGMHESERLDEAREAIREAASIGCRSLQAVGVKHISVETFGNAEAAAEGSHLGVWSFKEFKTKKKDDHVLPEIEVYKPKFKVFRDEWEIGRIKAEAQNVARQLMDMPSNRMTPSIFARVAGEHLIPLGLEVKSYDEEWIRSMKMDSFLSVAKGSVEPPVFLEINYRNGAKDAKPAVLVGKGVTFDSGGISIKPSAKMDEMRADMGGAACVVATLLAAAKLKLRMNITGLIPLCENMPSGGASRPGDIVTAMNGKTIQIDNTDAEGRLILADALCYAKSFDPEFTLDIATLTGAMRVALGEAATGVFTNSTDLWEELEKSASYAGDRVWRFPLWNYYSKQVTDFPAVDVNNIGKGKGGGSCTAAAFLKEFSPPGPWLHLDIAGVMGPNDESPYLHKGMTGRSTRTLTQFLLQQSRL